MRLYGIMDEPAGVAELVDALDSGSSGHSLWGFKSPLPHIKPSERHMFICLSFLLSFGKKKHIEPTIHVFTRWIYKN